MRFRSLTLVILLVGIVACQPLVSTEPRQVAEWQPTAAAVREPAAISTPAPTATVAAAPEIAVMEQTLPDLAVPTREPTAVPPNVFTQELSGLALPFPSTWEIVEQNSNALQLFDTTQDLFVSILVEVQEDESDFDSVLQQIIDNPFIVEEGEIAVTDQFETPFGGDGMAQVAVLDQLDEEAEQIQLWVAYVDIAPRTLTMLVFGTPTTIENRQTTLRTMLSNASVGEKQLFGLNREETLVLQGFDPAVEGLDPARTEGSAAGYVGLLYRGLVRLGPDLQVMPDLAGDWTVSEDGTVYTFTLRDNIAFFDGEPITADDVVYSWERATDPETESRTASTYLGDIVGVREKLAGEADSISGVRAIDERTVEVTLDGAKPFFLAKLTYPTSYIVDEGSVDAADDSWVFEPNSSGPYGIKEYTEGEALIFERNEGYHTPALTENVVYLVAPAGSPVSLYEAGEIDVVYLGGETAAEVRRPSDERHSEWVSTTSLCTTLLQVNNSLPPFDDLLVRQAFAQAVDKEMVGEIVSEGTNVIAQTILPPAMPGYSADLAADIDGLLGFDPEAARASLAASSYADSLPPVTILAAGFGDSERDDLNAIVTNWQEILGAEVNIEFLDPINFDDLIEEVPGHLVSYGWCADYPDPENFLDLLYYSESDFNQAGYNNPEVDALLEEARSEGDPAVRLELYQELERLMLEDVAAIPLQHNVTDALVKPQVEGFVLLPIGAPIVDLLAVVPQEDNSGEEE